MFTFFVCNCTGVLFYRDDFLTIFRPVIYNFHLKNVIDDDDRCRAATQLLHTVIRTVHIAISRTRDFFIFFHSHRVSFTTHCDCQLRHRTVHRILCFVSFASSLSICEYIKLSVRMAIFEFNWKFSWPINIAAAVISITFLWCYRLVTKTAYQSTTKNQKKFPLNTQFAVLFLIYLFIFDCFELWLLSIFYLILQCYVIAAALFVIFQAMWTFLCAANERHNAKHVISRKLLIKCTRCMNKYEQWAWASMCVNSFSCGNCSSKYIRRV